MSYSTKGFKIPEYGDAADIPALVEHNVGILESLLDSFCMSFEARIIAENAGIYKSLGIGYYDCGTFTTAQTGEIIDGGDFESVGGTVIDGGDFFSTAGEVIDGGHYTSNGIEA